jgi:hypothetical protein
VILNIFISCNFSSFFSRFEINTAHIENGEEKENENIIHMKVGEGEN